MEPAKPPRSVLVTGGAGYVGSHTVVRLLEEGYKVVVVDNLSNSYREDGCQEPESLIRAQRLAGRRLAECVQVDLRHEKALAEVFDKHRIECVVHFAALKCVSESIQKPLEYYGNNITGTLILLKVMLEKGVGRFLFSSSANIYGTPRSLPVCETHPTGVGITNPYGRTKYMIEELLRDAVGADEDLRVVSLRYFNPVGAHRSGDMGEDPAGLPTNLMPYVAQVAVGKLPFVRVFGDDYPTKDGTGVRDFIHIEDLAEGHVNALERVFAEDFAGFKAYNLGTGRGHSVLEVVEAFSKASGRQVRYKVVARREGDVAESFCDASLARAELGWTATKSLADICEDTWRWQVKNPDGYARSKSDET